MSASHLTRFPQKRLLASLALTVLLAGCGGGDDPGPAQPQSITPSYINVSGTLANDGVLTSAVVQGSDNPESQQVSLQFDGETAVFVVPGDTSGLPAAYQRYGMSANDQYIANLSNQPVIELCNKTTLRREYLFFYGQVTVLSTADERLRAVTNTEFKRIADCKENAEQLLVFTNIVDPTQGLGLGFTDLDANEDAALDPDGQPIVSLAADSRAEMDALFGENGRDLDGSGPGGNVRMRALSVTDPNSGNAQLIVVATGLADASDPASGFLRMYIQTDPK